MHAQQRMLHTTTIPAWQPVTQQQLHSSHARMRPCVLLRMLSDKQLKPDKLSDGLQHTVEDSDCSACEAADRFEPSSHQLPEWQTALHNSWLCQHKQTTRPVLLPLANSKQKVLQKSVC
jgi:hypothetical protein